ncbi:MAG: 1-(5-phosphoribosyl)-5-[(5-phosphoribosylamino)methylideneamino]imidazole-4-carboxamide isomerase [Pyrinomonadaceae bacterium]|nr:1-(5-phosphoribosyl)-5-[(5-phosphoribosylamino)methylideneamino]imidazole-4-carboxamide isomerase [Pyrinomonadaceae bacterium]
MIEIIPAIDIIGGKCVRLSEGDFARKTVYDDDPASVARRFADAGIRRLHVVDLDGAKTGSPKNLTVLERIAAINELTVDFGGGIKNDRDIAAAFDAGAAIVSVGSVAVKDPATLERWIGKYGGERIFLGADARDGMIAVNGWQTATEYVVVPFLQRWVDAGIKSAFVTDISKDGMLAGPAVELYKDVVAAMPQLALVASGGVSSMDDIRELDRIGCAGVIIGKAIYEGRVTVEEISEYVG